MDETLQPDLVLITAQIVVVYISKNPVPANGLPELIAKVHGACAGLSGPTEALGEAPITKPTPAQIKRSITPDALISFVDGKPYKTLKRHLTTHGLSLKEYRGRYGLPADYPTVAPNYSAARSALAKDLGLGRKQPVSQPDPAPKRSRTKRGTVSAPDVRRPRIHET